jgi:protein involved in polysaccharide export with SLBB domain
MLDLFIATARSTPAHAVSRPVARRSRLPRAPDFSRATLVSESAMRMTHAMLRRWRVIGLVAAAALIGVARAEPADDSAVSLERPALEGGVAASSYVIGPGDRMLLEIWGLHELTQEIEVTAEGRLVVPRAGVFAAGGETLAALRRAVESRLRTLYPRLEVALTLARPRTFLVHVTGAVARPGTYPATPMTRVSALLPRAGGALPSGSLRRVEIRRRGRAQPLRADLVRFGLLGETDSDPPLLDGDTLYVPTRGLTVEVTGAVARPGSYELTGEPTLAALLQLAGGRAPRASSELPLRVAGRAGGDRVVVRSVAYADAAHTPLADGDVVHVPGLGDRARVVIVEGAVVGPTPPPDEARRETPADAQPREASVQLPFVDGDGVRDLIAKAGGLQPWADAHAAYLLRARRQIPVDAAAILDGARADVTVAAGDTLVIPTRRRQVLVGGAVQKPGLYPYSRDLGPRDYLSLAGGASRTGNPAAARVLTQNGSLPIAKVKEIQPGDVITVPEKSMTSAEWAGLALILGNIAIGAVALGVAAAH